MNQLQDYPLVSGQCMAVMQFGQSIANSLGSRHQVFAFFARNAEDGISFFKLPESATWGILCFNNKLRELGIQYANKDLLTTTDEAALDAEAVAIGDAIDSIADNVKFNGTQLIGSVAGGGAVTIGINDAGNTATIGTATTIAITNTDNITGANGVDGSGDLEALGQIAKSLGNVAAGMSALKGYQAGSY